jgi:hypothetical protein
VEVKARPLPRAPLSFNQNYKFFLVVVVVGGYVVEGEHFHAFRALSCAVSVGSAAVRALPDRPHIHRQFLSDVSDASGVGTGLYTLPMACRADAGPEYVSSCFASPRSGAVVWPGSRAKPLYGVSAGRTPENYAPLSMPLPFLVSRRKLSTGQKSRKGILSNSKDSKDSRFSAGLVCEIKGLFPLL